MHPSALPFLQVYNFFLIFGCETVLKLLFAGLLYNKKMYKLRTLLPELILLGKIFEIVLQFAVVLLKSDAGIGLQKMSDCTTVSNEDVFMKNESLKLQKLEIEHYH